MTGGTGAGRGPRLREVRTVASGTGDAGMPPLQGITSQGMIEVAAADAVEAGRDVALAALRGHPALVRIAMTRRAFLERNRLVDRDSLSRSVALHRHPARAVTRIAQDLSMLAGQGIRGRIVVEPHGALPVAGIVTASAALDERALVCVIVAVTGDARRFEADPSRRRATPRESSCRPGTIPGRVTRFALHVAMALFERPAGLEMVESIACPTRPRDERKVTSRVIGMTACAFLLPCRSRARMEPPATFHEPADFAVAIRAHLGHGSLAERMTLAAVARPFEVLVCRRQRSRRDLGGKTGSWQEGHDRHQQLESAPHPASTASCGIGTSFCTIRTPRRSRKAYGASPPIRITT